VDIDIYNMIENYNEWFYIITFAWTFIEGETFVIFAGAAASQDVLNICLLIAVSWLGSFCGDQCYFWIGRRWGVELLQRFPRFQGGVDVALDMLNRYHVGFILSFRFIYGVRNFASFAMGMSVVPWQRFAALNFIAAGLWANVFCWGGYLLGVAFEAVLGDIAKDFGYIMLGLFAIVGIVLFFVHRASKVRFRNKVAVLKLAEHPKPSSGE
jgi:membrane protein DedA with SNARE-associated domain